MTVERQFVGGPLDGQTKTVPGDGRDIYLPVTEDEVIDYGPPPAITYRLATAPTGERVYIADDTCWPDRFDTAAWPPRGLRLGPLLDVAPHERVETWHWRRLGNQGSWCWRGDVTDPDSKPRPRPWFPVVYVLGSPARPGDFIASAQRITFDLADPREMALSALAGHGTVEDEIVRELRYRIARELLPPCPAPGCTGKAEVQLRALHPARPAWVEQDAPLFNLTKEGWGPSPGTVQSGEMLDMCPAHAADERRRLDHMSRPLWDVHIKDLV